MSLRRYRLMRRPPPKRKCKHGRTFFAPDPRNVRHQHYCAQPACRQASKAASQRRWLQQPGNRDYFRGPTQVERVRQWRQAHPGYWRRQRTRPPEALQENLSRQETPTPHLDAGGGLHALPDSFFMQPTMFVELIAHLTGLTFQDAIATTARRLQQVGRDILARSPLPCGGRLDAQTPHFVGQTPTRPSAVQLGGSAPSP